MMTLKEWMYDNFYVGGVIAGSRYKRAYCCECDEPIRVPESFIPYDLKTATLTFKCSTCRPHYEGKHCFRDNSSGPSSERNYNGE